MNYSIEEIESIIGIPVNEWVGKCHLIANEFLKYNLIKGKLCYGNYFGYIDSESIFSDYDFPHHGWVLLDDGRIFDPTRWVFENVEPYFYIDFDFIGEYDFGGNKFRELISSPKPDYNEKSRQFELNQDSKSIFQNLIGCDREFISIEEIMWVANLSINILSSNAKIVFEYISDNGLGAFIPIDNRKFILGD